MRASQTVGHFVRESAGWAVGCASAAGFTARIKHVGVCSGDWMSIKSTLSHRPDKAALNFGASPHAARALNTPVQIHPHEWVGVAISDVACALDAPLGNFRMVFISQILELARAANIACQAVSWMIGEKQFQDGLARFLDGGAVVLHFHPFGGGQRTRSHRRSPALNIDHTNTASAGGMKVRMVAQGGNGHAGMFRCLQDGHPFGDLGILAVDF